MVNEEGKLSIFQQGISFRWVVEIFSIKTLELYKYILIVLVVPSVSVSVNPNGFSSSRISFGERSWAINPCCLARWYALQAWREGGISTEVKLWTCISYVLDTYHFQLQHLGRGQIIHFKRKKNMKRQPVHNSFTSDYTPTLTIAVLVTNKIWYLRSYCNDVFCLAQHR